MRFVDISLTASQLAGVASQIGGEPDIYRAVKGLQLVEVTAWRGSATFQTVGINPDNAIFDVGMKEVQL